MKNQAPVKWREKTLSEDCPGGPVAKIPCSQYRGRGRVWSPVRELDAATKDPTCCKEDGRFHVPKLRPGAAKQINIKKPRCSPEGVRGPPWPHVSPSCLPHVPVLTFIPWIHFLWAFLKPLPLSSSEVRTWPNSSHLPSPSQLNDVAGGNCPASPAGLTWTREITDLKGAQDVLSVSLASWLSVPLQFDLFPFRPSTQPALSSSWWPLPSLPCADWSSHLGTSSLPSTRAQASATSHSLPVPQPLGSILFFFLFHLLFFLHHSSSVTSTAPPSNSSPPPSPLFLHNLVPYQLLQSFLKGKWDPSTLGGKKGHNIADRFSYYSLAWRCLGGDC